MLKAVSIVMWFFLKIDKSVKRLDTAKNVLIFEKIMLDLC